MRILLCLLTFVLGTGLSVQASSRSVYQVSPALDGSIITVGVLGTVIPYSNAENLIRPRCPCDPGEVNALDRPVIGNANDFLDSVSDVTAGAALILPPFLDWIDLGTSPELLEDYFVYAEVLSVNSALTTLSKYVVQRPLPRTYAGDPSLINHPGGYRSFFSGHASSTFAALSASAVTLNLRHRSGTWPWIVTGAVGLSVALERVAAGRHFYTDVAVGALSGALVGTVIPLLHRRDSSSGVLVSIRPVPGGAMVWVPIRF